MLTLIIVSVVDNGHSICTKSIQDSKQPINTPSQRAPLPRKYILYVIFTAPSASIFA